MRGASVPREKADEFSIRKFRDRDLPAIYEIEQEIFTPPWPRSAFLYIAKSGWGARGEILLLEHRPPDSKPKPVGYTCLMWEAGIGHILNLAIRKPFRGRKLGERLLAAGIQRLREKGVSKAVLEVRSSNSIARELYEKNGFTLHHVQKGYYPDGEDGLVMVKPLGHK